MKIGIVVDNELSNDKRVLREAHILYEAGKKINILCFAYNRRIYKDFKEFSVTRIRVPQKLKNFLFLTLNSIPLYHIFWAWNIRKFILSNNLKLIHVHDLYMSRSAYLGIKMSGKNVKLILDLHENFAFTVNTYNWTKGFFRRGLSRPQDWLKKEEKYLKYADKIIVLSDEFAEALVNKYPSLNRYDFISLPNVPDVEAMDSYARQPVSLKFEKKAIVLFYFGIIAERRGIFTALDSFEQVIKGGKELTFLIIGPVDKKDKPLFDRYLKKESLARKVIWIPWIDLSELPAYLDASDICIAPFEKNPQHESGVANKIYDYMLGRKPLIVSDCKPQKILVEKYNCGISFSNIDELACAIVKLSENEMLRKEMGNNGYDAILNELNTKKIKSKLLELYTQLEQSGD